MANTSNLPPTPSSGADAFSSSFERPSSEAYVYTDEDVKVAFSHPPRDDGGAWARQSAGVDMRQQRSSSGSCRSSSASTTSPIPEDDVEAGYEADSGTRTTSRRQQVRRIRARSRRASGHVHSLFEHVEPIVEIPAPLTAKELAYTNIPIPAHCEHLLPGNAEEALGTPSTTSSTSEILTPLDELGLECVVEDAQLVTAHLVTELERRSQPDPPASPDPHADIYLDDHVRVLGFRDLPPTPDLRPWLAVASGEPSPMVLASPAALRVIGGPRPRLVRMSNHR